MTNTNIVILIGNLTRDADVSYTQGGSAKASLSLAVNRSRKNGDTWEDEVNYFDVVLWGNPAENLKPYLTKGQKIAVTGSLKQDRWEKDGQKFSRVSVQASSVELVGGRRNDENGDDPRTTFKKAGTVKDAPAPNGFIANEDIPF